MSSYEASDQFRQKAMEWGLISFTVGFCALTLMAAAWAGGQAYYLITDPPSYCVPARPHL